MNRGIGWFLMVSRCPRARRSISSWQVSIGLFPLRLQSGHKYLACSHFSDEIKAIDSPVGFDADAHHALHLLIVALPRGGFLSVRHA
jgi:hypothetical protein